MAAATGIGGTATHGDNTEISVMPTTGSSVNFSNGRPLAAMVATTFGVSIVALLADPGTEVFIDLDRTRHALDAVVEVMVDGTVIASSVSSYDEQSLIHGPLSEQDFFTTNVITEEVDT